MLKRSQQHLFQTCQSIPVENRLLLMESSTHLKVYLIRPVLGIYLSHSVTAIAYSCFIYLLCVSYPSATEFSAIIVLFFARSSSNSPRLFQRFRRTLRRDFNWIRQQMKNFPIDPHVKIARFQQRYNVAESGHFLQWGSMGKFFTLCQI